MRENLHSAQQFVIKKGLHTSIIQLEISKEVYKNSFNRFEKIILKFIPNIIKIKFNN